MTLAMVNSNIRLYSVGMISSISPTKNAPNSQLFSLKKIA